MPSCSELGYKKNDILLFKYNGTPTQSNGFLVLDDINPSNTVSTEEHSFVGDGQMNNMRKSNDLNNTQSDIPISVLVEGTGALGIAPKIADFYKAAGMAETVVAGESVTYKPHFGIISPSTAVVFKGGQQKTTYTNMIAGLTLSGTIGTDIKIDFSLTGFTDLLKTSEAPAVDPIVFRNPFKIDLITAVTAGGASINIESFELAANLENKKGYFTELKCAYRSDINPALTLTAVKALNDATAWSDFLNQTPKEIIIVAKNADNETLTIAAKNALPQLVEDSDSDGILTETRPYDLKKDNNGVSFEIKYT